MTQKQWNDLKDGDIIYNKLDGYNKIKKYEIKDYADDLFLISCDKQGNETGKSLFAKSMFDMNDWCIVKIGAKDEKEL